MQQEDISGQLQEELRLRPQTINKYVYNNNNFCMRPPHSSAQSTVNLLIYRILRGFENID